jgi:hypothetical protein
MVAEVPHATPTMQAVQDSWMGLVTRRAVGTSWDLLCSSISYPIESDGVKEPTDIFCFLLLTVPV